jgi:hypothetical protein
MATDDSKPAELPAIDTAEMIRCDPRVHLSKEQADESFRSKYRIFAIEYGMHYYIAGRFAAHARFSVVCASLLHHAVELLIKACLAETDTATQIREYGYRHSYSHSLDKLWAEFRRRNSTQDLQSYDKVIAELDKFEDIRYPDSLADFGAVMSVGLYEVEQPLATLRSSPEPYVLMLPQIDRLMTLLFQRTGYSFEALQLHWSADLAMSYLKRENRTPPV